LALVAPSPAGRDDCPCIIENVASAGTIVVGASRSADAKVDAGGEEEALALFAPPPPGLAGARVGQDVVAAPNVALRVRRANTEVDASEEEALALVAPIPVGLAGARVAESIAAAGAVVVSASGRANPETVVTGEEQPFALAAELPVDLQHFSLTSQRR